MATISMLQWKQSFPVQSFSRSIITHTNGTLIQVQPPKLCSPLHLKASSSPTYNCMIKYGFISQKASVVESVWEVPVKEEKPKTLIEIIADSILKALPKPAMAAVLVGLLLMYDPNSALAASAGRMGGRSFSKHSSSSSESHKPSSSSSSSSYHEPSSSSSYQKPFSSSLSDESSSSSSSSSNHEPFSSSSSSSNHKPSSSSSSSSYHEPSSSSPSLKTHSVPRTSSPGFLYFLMLMGFVVAFVLVLAYLSHQSESSELRHASQQTSVLKLQVGLSGTARSLQTELNRIAEAADTSSPQGLSYILTETTVALLRHPDYFISGYSSVDLKRSVEDCEKQFNLLSIEERGKVDEETLVNVDNIKSKSTRSQRSNNGLSNEYIVITILAAAEGVLKLPTINGSGDLKEALKKLGSIPCSKLLAVEVLWTPQDENDILSKELKISHFCGLCDIGLCFSSSELN